MYVIKDTFTLHNKALTVFTLCICIVIYDESICESAEIMLQ